MFKKIFSAMLLAAMIFICGQNNFAKAKDIWVYKYPNGNSLYIVYESVVYGYKTGFYAYFRIKRVNELGELIRTEKWEIGHDEGDWWYGIEGISRVVRVYDYEDSTEVLNWLEEHKNQAKQTADPIRRVLSD